VSQPGNILNKLFFQHVSSFQNISHKGLCHVGFMLDAAVAAVDATAAVAIAAACRGS